MILEFGAGQAIPTIRSQGERLFLQYKYYYLNNVFIIYLIRSRNAWMVRINTEDIESPYSWS